MKLIIGLGNPGSEYERTRHNVGFRVIDALANKQGWRWERNGRAMIANGTLGIEKVVLVKPITYMNKSGEAIGELMRWYKVQPADMLVIYDELDLPVGKIRVRGNGSAGGHNGIKSIIAHLHTDQFPRVRVGIGRPTHTNFKTVDYVLGAPPGGDEQIQLATGESAAVEAVPLILQQGVPAAMNILNADPEAQQKAEEKRRQQQERRERERLRKAEADAQQELKAQELLRKAEVESQQEQDAEE